MFISSIIQAEEAFIGRWCFQNRVSKMTLGVHLRASLYSSFFPFELFYILKLPHLKLSIPPYSYMWCDFLLRMSIFKHVIWRRRHCVQLGAVLRVSFSKQSYFYYRNKPSCSQFFPILICMFWIIIHSPSAFLLSSGIVSRAWGGNAGVPGGKFAKLMLPWSLLH